MSIAGIIMEAKRKIRARDIVNDIRSHMTDAELMAKYNLSARGLQSVFVKLLNAKAITRTEIDWRPSAYDDTMVIRQVKTSDMADDIRSGMTDFGLMRKYSVSAEGLRKAFKILVEAGALRPEEFENRSSLHDDTVFIECIREMPRHYLALTVPIHEAGRPESRGVLRDITEKGVGIAGIPATVDEVKSLVIPARQFIESDKIVFEARCVWSQKEEDEGRSVAGFQISDISENSLKDLRSLIRSLCFCG